MGGPVTLREADSEPRFELSQGRDVESPLVLGGETEDAARFEAGRKTPNGYWDPLLAPRAIGYNPLSASQHLSVAYQMVTHRGTRVRGYGRRGDQSTVGVIASTKSTMG